MSDWQRDTTPQHTHPVGDPDILEFTAAPATRRAPADSGPSCVTAAGADWLASASVFPASVRALWRHRPDSPSVLPCGTVFDVVSTPPLPGRRLLDRLWSTGPGSGPVAVHRGRMLLFASPGTAQRLPALLSWGEWWEPKGTREQRRLREPAIAETFPPLLCHGLGDFVTIPALLPQNHDGDHDGDRERRQTAAPSAPSRWLVAPDLRDPWLPGPEVLLRACVGSHRERRAPHLQLSVRAGRGFAAVEQSISETADRDAKVYDVTRRR
ncbi:MAG TPA: bifunctional DNA primase/polymerase [Streptomyces sp.]|nr:bifunctional DNA primase/polymerase [Streptomyces sp.]